MSGNPNKRAWNKKHGLAHSSKGGISDMVKIATDIEEAAWAVNTINWRTKRERQKAREEKKRRSITLPTLKFMGRDE